MGRGELEDTADKADRAPPQGKSQPGPKPHT